MKKLFSILLVAAMVLSIGTAIAFAEQDASDAGSGTVGQDVFGPRFVDEDGDGVCDLCGGADLDGDGVCDNCPYGGLRPQDGTGRRAGNRAGKGTGQNGPRFVDADGDGVCDHYAAGGARPQDGTGRRAGNRAGKGAGQGAGNRAGKGAGKGAGRGAGRGRGGRNN